MEFDDEKSEASMTEWVLYEDENLLQETIVVPQWKLKFVESQIRNSPDTQYKLQVDQSQSSVTIRGTQDGVANGKAEVLKALDSVCPVPCDGISKKLASILSSPRGEAELARLGFQGSFLIEHERVFLATSAFEERYFVEKLADIIGESVLPIEVHEAFLETTQWQAFSQEVESDHLVEIDVSLANKEIYFRGVNSKHAMNKIQMFLTDQVATKQFIAPSRPGELRFFEKYLQASLQDLDVSSQMTEVGGREMLEIDLPKSSSTRSALEKRLESRAYRPILLKAPGVTAAFASTSGEILIKGLEQKCSSVIEKQRELTDSSCDECSDEEEFFAMTESSASSAPKASSTKDWKGEEGHLLFKQGNVSLRLYRGNITKHKMDVLVNTLLMEGASFVFRGDVAQEFLTAGGEKLKEKYHCQPEKKKKKVIPTPAFAELTSVCERVYHIGIEKWSGTTQKTLQEKLDSCINLCVMEGYSSIAFPTIGCGNLKYPVDKVAECFRTAVKKQSTGKHPTRVAIVAYESGPFDDLKRAFRTVDYSDEGVRGVQPKEQTKTVNVRETQSTLCFWKSKPSVKQSSPSLLTDEQKREQSRDEENTDGLLLYSESALSVMLYLGNITAQSASVLVNTMPLVHGAKNLSGAVAKAFFKAGGEDLKKEHAKKAKGAGTFVATDAFGDLKNVCQRVYHLSLRHWDSSQESELQSLLAKCLKECLSERFSSIAFPTVGCGRLGYPAEVVARCFRAELDKLKGRKLKISIVAYDPELYGKFAATFKGDALKISLGDWVRLKPGITNPRFGWGAINFKSVGLVIAMEGQENSARIVVNFKVDNEWEGLVGEIEAVESASDATCKLKVGDRVQIRPEVDTPRYDWGQVSHTSVGDIVWIGQTNEGIGVKVNFPERAGWTGLSREMKLVKPSGTPQHFLIGDTVRVKSAVKHPKYGWESVEPNSVGHVVCIEAKGRMRVTYPEKSYWYAQAEEMEHVVVHFGTMCDRCKQSPLRGHRYKCRQCDDYNLCENCFSGNMKHRHQFDKTTEPGQPAVPISVNYSRDEV